MIEYGYGCYSDKDSFNIYQVKKSINKIYIITFPIINCFGHYGFEVYERNKLIGFTMDEVFSDKNKYPDNYIPNYKIIAYDRLLNHSRFPEESFPHDKITGL